jgi:phytol kinase
MTDPLAVVVSFVYVFAVLGIAEALRKALTLPVEFTRKVVHIGVGMWAWGTAALFTNKWFAIICPAAFILLNYISYKRGLFLAIESNDKSNLGTVYFPISFVVLIILLFDVNKTMFIASLMPLTWGDSFAAIIGKRYGRHHYAVLGNKRSLEGSMAMLVMSFISVLIPLLAGERFQLSPDTWLVVLWAALVALAATLVEAVTPNGLDNLLVPLVTVLALFVFGYLAAMAAFGFGYLDT